MDLCHRIRFYIISLLPARSPHFLSIRVSLGLYFCPVRGHLKRIPTLGGGFLVPRWSGHLNHKSKKSPGIGAVNPSRVIWGLLGVATAKVAVNRGRVPNDLLERTLTQKRKPLPLTHCCSPKCKRNAQARPAKTIYSSSETDSGPREEYCGKERGR